MIIERTSIAGRRILPKHRYSLPPLRFSRPFLDCYEARSALCAATRLDVRPAFLTKLGRAVARRLGQEISNRADAVVVFRCPPALSAAAIACLLSRLANGDAALPRGLGSAGGLNSASRALLPLPALLM